jgi:hypothetical protein
MDIVAEYIELRKTQKETDEKIEALELIILSEHRNDDRITIMKPRVTKKIKSEVYERLEQIGIPTEVTETRKKELKEFDIDVQNILNTNDENFEIKLSKESIRVK